LGVADKVEFTHGSILKIEELAFLMPFYVRII